MGRIASLSLVALLGLSGGFWASEGAIAPSIVQAYTSRVNITLDRQPNESFATLVRRAEAVARAAAQRSFDNDILVSEAAIVVTGENIGLSAPILTLQVTRDSWKNNPDAQRWATYYPNSKKLLRIDDPVPTVAVSPQTAQRPEPTLGTGDIQTTLRWSTTDDLDLEVIDPSNQRVFFQRKTVPSGGQLDVDSNAGCQNTITNPVENIFWPPAGAPRGNYVVRVNLYQRCATQTGPIAFRLRLLVQGNTRDLTGNVNDSQRTVTFPFTLGTPGPRTPNQQPGNTPNNNRGGNRPGSNRPGNSGQSSPNRSGSGTQRTNPASGSGSGSGSDTRNTPTNRSGNNSQNSTTQPTSPNNAQPSNNTNPNTSQPTYGPGLIRRARDLQQRINNNNANP